MSGRKVFGWLLGIVLVSFWCVPPAGAVYLGPEIDTFSPGKWLREGSISKIIYHPARNEYMTLVLVEQQPGSPDPDLVGVTKHNSYGTILDQTTIPDVVRMDTENIEGTQWDVVFDVKNNKVLILWTGYSATWAHILMGTTVDWDDLSVDTFVIDSSIGTMWNIQAAAGDPSRNQFLVTWYGGTKNKRYMGAFLTPSRVGYQLGSIFNLSQLEAYDAAIAKRGLVYNSVRGEYLMVYHDWDNRSLSENGSQLRGIYADRIGERGLIQGGIKIQQDETIFSHANPVVAAGSDGSYLAVWTMFWADVDESPGPHDIRGKRLNSDGTPTGSLLGISGFGEGKNDRPLVAAGTFDDGGPGYLVTWRTPTEDDDYRGFGRFISSAGGSDVFAIGPLGTSYSHLVAGIAGGPPGWLVCYYNMVRKWEEHAYHVRTVNGY